MLLQYASDLHLEFPSNKIYLGPKPLEPLADHLILAGDIMPLAQMEKHVDFFDYLSGHFKQTYWLMGNHEHYGSDISNFSGHTNQQIRHNIHLVNNHTVEIQGVRIIFSTLWTKIGSRNQQEIERRLTDFRKVKYKGKRFNTDVFNQLHLECLDYIKSQMQLAKSASTIVITHHVPTFLHYPEKYKESVLNEGFGVELSSWVASNGPDFWIYGHHHNNTPDFTIGKTLMLTNQLGYVERGEHKNFSRNRVLDIE